MWEGVASNAGGVALATTDSASVCGLCHRFAWLGVVPARICRLIFRSGAPWDQRSAKIFS